MNLFIIGLFVSSALWFYLFNQRVELDYSEDVPLKDWRCILWWDGSEISLTSQEEYRAFVDSVLLSSAKAARGPCDEQAPFMDFSEESVLGYSDLWGGGCSARVKEKQVHRDDRHEVIIYSITIIEEGSCAMAIGLGNHLVTVPKIPENYDVEFEIITAYGWW